MSQRRTANQPPPRNPISRYFKPATPSTTPPISPASRASSPATTSSTAPCSPTAHANSALRLGFPVKAIVKGRGKQADVRAQLQSKTKCPVKVDKTADARYPKPDVVMTVDRMVREARKMARESDGAIKVSMKESYPWEWWECLYENCLFKGRYYDAKCLHRNVCRCCENARWKPRFKVLENGLCTECDKVCPKVPTTMSGCCSELATVQRKRQRMISQLPRRINVIATADTQKLPISP